MEKLYMLLLSRYGEFVVPTRFSNYRIIPTFDEFWEFVELFTEFYAEYDDDQIRAINEATEASWLKDTYEFDTANVSAFKKGEQASSGFVYLLKADTNPITYKIGRTNNPQNRAKTFGVKLPFNVEFICVIPTSNMAKLEDELHAKFADKRINGEFFSLSASDIEYIRDLANGG